MDSELIKILKSLKDDAEFRPGTEFRVELKNQLMAAVPRTGWFIAWEMPWKNWNRRLAPAVAGLVAMLMGTTVVMAQKSLPADLLYPIKIAGERTAMAIMPTGRQKAEAAAAIIDRRLTEIKQLQEKYKDEVTEEVIAGYRDYLLRAEDFRQTTDEAWAIRIDRHWQTLEQLEKKPDSGIEGKELPEIPVRIERVPTIAKSAEPELPPSPAGNKIIEEDKSDIGQAQETKENKKENVVPEIQITVPVLQDLLSPILP